MSANTFKIDASLREGVGKGAARAVRREKKVPAVIYGDTPKSLYGLYCTARHYYLPVKFLFLAPCRPVCCLSASALPLLI